MPFLDRGAADSQESPRSQPHLVNDVGKFMTRLE
jgi:hypothetical protein